MYCRSGTGGRCCIGGGWMLRVHSPGGSTFMREMTSWPPCWKYDVISVIPLPMQSMWYDVTLSRWRPWRHFTQNGAAAWWVHTQYMPGAASTSSWSIVHSVVRLKLIEIRGVTESPSPVTPAALFGRPLPKSNILSAPGVGWGIRYSPPAPRNDFSPSPTDVWSEFVYSRRRPSGFLISHAAKFEIFRP